MYVFFGIVAVILIVAAVIISVAQKHISDEEASDE
jgi:hypothetical protein